MRNVCREFPGAGEGYSGGGGTPEVLRELRGCADDLFPGRDCISARMRGRPIPRERL